MFDDDDADDFFFYVILPVIAILAIAGVGLLAAINFGPPNRNKPEQEETIQVVDTAPEISEDYYEHISAWIGEHPELRSIMAISYRDEKITQAEFNRIFDEMVMLQKRRFTAEIDIKKRKALSQHKQAIKQFIGKQ